MFKILVVDSGVIDREMIRDTLTEGLEGPLEIHMAVGAEQAKAILERENIDLLIADAPRAAYVKNLVYTAYGTNSSVRVILTTVKREDEIAQIANRLNAAGYLLKPFRREHLVAMVRPLEEAVKEDLARAGEAERSAYLERIRASIQECQYKKSIETAKEYIEFLCETGDNKNVIRTRMVEFAAGLAELGHTQSQEVQNQLGACLERFRSRFDLQGNPFEVSLVIEEMVDIIFNDLDRRQLYSDDDLKRVLNYIDRNIKRGITLDDAAECVNMSSSYFSKFFKKSTGINFITYVTDRKIEFAKDMLRSTDMPVINIAYELSYNETNYFSKAFKKKVGMTPVEYRERCAREAGQGRHTTAG